VPGFDREQAAPGNRWHFVENSRPPDSVSGIFEG
jgi:hypothetical protein